MTPARAYSAGITVSGPSLWVCASISPGIRYLPVRSTVRVSGRSRVRALGASPVMRPPSTTTVMPGAGGAPDPSITVTWVSANGPVSAPFSALGPAARAVPAGAVLVSAVPVMAAAPARNPRRAMPRCAPTVASDMLFPLLLVNPSAVSADPHDSGGHGAIGQCGQTVRVGVLLGPPRAVPGAGVAPPVNRPPAGVITPLRAPRQGGQRARGDQKHVLELSTLVHGRLERPSTTANVQLSLNCGRSTSVGRSEHGRWPEIATRWCGAWPRR